MKPHPRIRKTVKWGGAAVSVVLMVVWVGSRWFFADVSTARGTGVGVAAGRLSFSYSMGSDDPRNVPLRIFRRVDTPLQ
jgi:hypothetical protein